ncbi:hypothetical protein [Aliivibrio fischeri]|uniref:DUF4760 domain-containing protein n=2 Tax=Aliivibrio fischeri TaxID=668 RepID=B5EU86_ALIFM|nr:hypothetical protein [Aliivibrio fischeri]ACH64406.1 conserved hypothetical protein [Aliivibrio fischeri MJ11]EHN68524.1 hypothetical protein VFSR5_A0606 [Aliivibrio fischeri SR5]
MFDWFSKTFESATQQATLFSIAVSTTLAVLLLLLNQWFSTQKDKRNLRAAKLEEFASTIYSYERLCFDILSRLYQQAPSDQITINKMVESVEISDKIEMLSSLYFPNIPFDSKLTQKTIYKVHRQFDMLELNNKSDPSSYISYGDATKTVKEVLSELKASVKLEMKKYT